jgi:hypothetical protein
VQKKINEGEKMIKQQQTFTLTVFVVIAILTAFTIPTHARVCHNGVEDGYDDGGGRKAEAWGSTGSIKTLIIEGAGNLLDSQAYMLLFLNKVEMSDLRGVDYSQLRDTLNKAIESMNQAVTNYRTLARKAAYTPYNQGTVYQLVLFDYAGFQKERNLNADIFGKLEHYLAKGDVTGTLYKTLYDTETLLKMMYSLKNTIDTDLLPDNSSLWRLNQKFSETMLFGQYSAEVHQKISQEQTQE